jgi:hypothetical protein
VLPALPFFSSFTWSSYYSKRSLIRINWSGMMSIMLLHNYIHLLAKHSVLQRHPKIRNLRSDLHKHQG